MKLKKNERFDDLQIGNLKLIQDKNCYCFTSDSVILANFVNAKKNEYICEIGAGTGIISILIAYKCNPKKITAFEVQKPIFNILKKNIKLNNFSNIINIINSPIQNCFNFVSPESFDIVVSNPPYLKINKQSFVSNNKTEAISKHEVMLSLDELILNAKKLLKFGGKFYIIYTANRCAELIYKLKLNNLEPKKMFFTSPKINTNPILVVIEAIKGGKENLIVLPTLITNDDDGNYIYTIQNLYKK